MKMKVGTKTNLNILNSIVMLICPVLNGKHPFRARFLKKKKKNFKTLWPLFIDGVQLPQGYSHFEEAVYFLPLSSQKFLVLILSTPEGWKAESTLEPPVVLSMEPLDWESRALTTRSFLHLNFFFKMKVGS